MLNTEKTSVLCKQMLVKYENLVAKGYIQWKVMGNDWSDKHKYGDKAQISLDWTYTPSG
jgi:hypothetical protein